MRVAAGSLYVGCQGLPVSARVGNFGCWGPGLGGESRSALGALTRDIARGDGTVWDRSPCSSSPGPAPLCAVRGATAELRLTRGSLLEEVPEPKASLVISSFPSAWEQTQPVVNCSSIALALNLARP